MYYWYNFLVARVFLSVTLYLLCGLFKVNVMFFLRFSEQSIASARASVMIYDDVNKKWVPSGSSSGLSKVHIYQHTVHQTFRVVGRKLQDHEVRFIFMYKETTYLQFVLSLSGRFLLVALAPIKVKSISYDHVEKKTLVKGVQVILLFYMCNWLIKKLKVWSMECN